MSRPEKVLAKILTGHSDANIRFGDLCDVLERLGFTLRIRGSHHVFTRVGVPSRICLQPLDGKAKPYQVRQVRDILVQHGFTALGGLRAE